MHHSNHTEQGGHQIILRTAAHEDFVMIELQGELEQTQNAEATDTSVGFLQLSKVIDIQLVQHSSSTKGGSQPPHRQPSLGREASASTQTPFGDQEDDGNQFRGCQLWSCWGYQTEVSVQEPPEDCNVSVLMACDCEGLLRSLADVFGEIEFD